MVATVLALMLCAAPTSPAIDVPLPPGELRGQVMGAGGAPVADFTVNGVRFQDPQGRFKVLTPPQGEFRVVIRAGGYAPNIFHVAGASGKKLQIPEIRLGAGEHALGEVLDAETELPVRGARATLADPAKLDRLRLVRPERVGAVATTGRGGCYEMRNTPRGLLVLVVTHPDYLTEFVQVNTREPLPTVLMHRGGGIFGVVRDAAGAPLAGASVVAVADDGSDAAEAPTDADGAFHLRRLRPSGYRLVALQDGRPIGRTTAEVEDGGIAEVTIAARAPRLAAR